MKLLFDQNLSPRLVDYLVDIYPQSTHVYHIGLDRAPDLAVWNFARDQGYVIVSQDSDFSDEHVARFSSQGNLDTVWELLDPAD